MPIRRPASVAELCDLVKQARAAGQGVFPVGGHTSLDVGLQPLKSGIALDTTALNRVIDYPARDMTITVQAGITIAALQAELAKEGQWLPVDVPNPENATLGGALALNQSGPRRYGHGTLRDYVIGISFATDDGVEVKAGGRVVKNVAGYDLMKLQIGAVGTLGVVTQVTLKVKPKPEASASVIFGCTGESLARVLDGLHASKSRPVAVDLWNQAWLRKGIRFGNDGAEWMIAVGYEEKAATVRWQGATLLEELGSLPVQDVNALPIATDGSSIWPSRTALQALPDSRFIWKASVPPSKVAEVVRAITAAPVDPSFLIQAYALSGIVWVHGPLGFDPGAAGSALSWMEQQITMAGGHYVMRRCPTEWKKQLRVWGKPTGAWDLMRNVKKTLDPDNVFNPGRLFGDV